MLVSGIGLNSKEAFGIPDDAIWFCSFYLFVINSLIRREISPEEGFSSHETSEHGSDTAWLKLVSQ